MDTKANYTIVGLFVIILCALMIAGFVWLSGFTHQQKYRAYLVYARDGVSGLTLDSPVQFNGVRVGSVSKIELDNTNPQLVRLYLKIENKVPITTSTVATLIPQGITGLVYIGLKAESPNAPLLTAVKGQPYPIIPFQKPFLTQITESLPELTKDMGDIAEKFKKIFNNQNVANISQTLDHLNAISGNLDKQSANIRSSIISLKTILKNGETASAHLDNTVLSMQQAAQQFGKTSADIRLQVDNISQQIMPNVQDLVNQLNDTAANVKSLSQDLNRNPAILVRGKQSPPPGPGEKKE